MAGVKGMFERGRKSPAYAEAVRDRIRAGGIVKRLEDHIIGKINLSPTQVTAALGLLRKVVSDKQGVEHSVDAASVQGLLGFREFLETVDRRRAVVGSEGLGAERSVLSPPVSTATQ